MSVYDTVLKRRSVRCFQAKSVPFASLKKLTNAARLAPTGANLQPCEFIIVDKGATVNKIFPTLKWAGYIQPLANPPEGRRPAAYIIALINNRKHPLMAEADVSSAITNILLVAQDEGLSSCWLGAIDRPKIRKILNIPRHCEIRYVVALGFPAERPKIESMRGSVRYWKDTRGRLHVPKRALKEVLHRNVY